MELKDYYKTLGVPPEATRKRSGRPFAVARKVHPDVNPGNKDAEEKFKTINEAYQVLSEVEQRKKYDQLREQYQQWQQSAAGPQDFDWQNWSAPVLEPDLSLKVTRVRVSNMPTPKTWKTSSEAALAVFRLLQQHFWPGTHRRQRPRPVRLSPPARGTGGTWSTKWS